MIAEHAQPFTDSTEYNERLQVHFRRETAVLWRLRNERAAALLVELVNAQSSKLASGEMSNFKSVVESNLATRMDQLEEIENPTDGNVDWDAMLKTERSECAECSWAE